MSEAALEADPQNWKALTNIADMKSNYAQKMDEAFSPVQ